MSKSNITQKEISENQYEKRFIEIFRQTAYRHSAWQIWSDFLYMAAVSLANAVPAPDREIREAEYLKRFNHYSPEDRELFPQLLALVVEALETNPEQDFLGSLYHALDLHQEQKGQFFTPYYISHFMAELLFSQEDLDEQLAGKGYISVNDPACGAGAMLIAFANIVKAKGINYQQKVLFVAQDIDRVAALMCFIQLSLLGCPAIIIVGDSLLKPNLHLGNEIWLSPFYYLNQWRFKGFQTKEEKTKVLEEAIRITETPALWEEANGQFRLPFLESA